MNRIIQVKYSCRKCGIDKRIVSVPVRLPGQDVVDWVKNVCAGAVSADHAQRSLHCLITQLDEVWIPLADDKLIGEVAE